MLSVAFLIGVFGTVIVRRSIENLRMCLAMVISKCWGRYFDVYGRVRLHGRFISNDDGVGHAMLDQFKTAKRITIFSGDYSFIDNHQELIDCLLQQRQLWICSCNTFDEVIGKTEKKDVQLLFKQVSEAGRFCHIPELGFRGSLVENDHGHSTLYSYVNLGDEHQPGIIHTYSTNLTANFGLHSSSIRGLILLVTLLARDRTKCNDDAK